MPAIPTMMGWPGAGGPGTSFAAPSVDVDIAAPQEGVASTALRSDARLRLSQAIAPTWTSLHTFNAGINVATGDIAVAGTTRIANNGDATFITTTVSSLRLPILGTVIDTLGKMYPWGIEIQNIGDYFYWRTNGGGSGSLYRILEVNSSDQLVFGGSFIGIPAILFYSNSTLRGQLTSAGHFFMGAANVNESGLGYSTNTTGHEGISMYHDGTEGFIDSVDAGTAWHDLTIRANNIRFDLIGNADRVVFTSAGQLQLPVTGSTGGIRIGGDVDLWRDAADLLRTQDNIQIDGTVGIGQAPVSGQSVTTTIDGIPFTGNVSDAGTTTTVTGLYLRHRTSGTAAAGFGVQYAVQLEDDGGTDRNASFDQTYWAVATSASRRARRAFFVADAGGNREFMRGEASGSAPMIGFYGGGAAVKQTVTGSRGGNAALASLLTALSTIGLITDSSSA